MKLWRAFIMNTNGATSIEYGVIGLVVTVSIVLAVNQLGTTLQDMYFSGISDKINSTAG